MSHTKGLLKVFEKDPTFIRTSEGRKHVGSTSSMGESETDEDNARRLVACWNACVGIETDVLEVTPSLEDVWNDVTKQRDELLAVETNLRQQVAHMTDQLAGEKSNVELANRQRDELIKALEHILDGSLSLPRFAEEQARAIIASVRKSQGKCYYAPDGTLLSPDGTRSIFDDVDQ